MRINGEKADGLRNIETLKLMVNGYFDDISCIIHFFCVGVTVYNLEWYNVCFVSPSLTSTLRFNVIVLLINSEVGTCTRISPQSFALETYALLATFLDEQNP